MYGERKLMARLRRHSMVARCCEVLIRDRVNDRMRQGQQCPHRGTAKLRVIEFRHWQAIQEITQEYEALRRLRRQPTGEQQ